jgi:hypothetical protein
MPSTLNVAQATIARASRVQAMSIALPRGIHSLKSMTEKSIGGVSAASISSEGSAVFLKETLAHIPEIGNAQDEMFVGSLHIACHLMPFA